MLMVAMILACITIPTSVSAAAVNPDYEEGDTIKQEFYASDPSDLAQISSSDNSEVKTEIFGGETYAYTTGGTASLNIPQIKPGVPSAEPIYVKLRLHSRGINGRSSAVYVYTLNSQGKRGIMTVADSEFGTTGMVWWRR